MNSHRKSRLPVSNSRSSLLNSAPRRSRSSAVSSRNTLSVQRSRSTTPSYSLSRQKSPLVKKDTRPLDNKKWQKEQAARVLAFIQKIEPSIEKLKPLSMNVFATIMFWLLKKLNAAVVITSANIATELPVILKDFGYPTKLTPSTLKWPNTDHAFPSVLGVMVFFLDIIEKDEADQTAVSFDPVKRGILNIAIPNFRMSYEGSELPYEEVRELMGKPTKEEIKAKQKRERDLECIQKSLAQKMKDFECTKEKAKKIRDQVSIMAGKNNSLKDQWNDLNDKMETVETACYKFERKIEQTENEISELKKQLEQLWPDSDVELGDEAEAEKRLTEYRRIETLQKERLDALMLKVNMMDFKLVQKKSETEAMVFKINNKLAELSHSDKSFSKFVLPEVGFSQESFIEDIDKLHSSVFDDILNRLKGDFEVMQKHRQEELSRNEKAKLALHSNYVDMLPVYKERIALFEKIKSTIERLEIESADLFIELDQLAVSKIDLQRDEYLYEKALQRKKKLMQAMVEQELEMREFVGIVKKSVMATNEKVLKITDPSKLAKHYTESGTLEIASEALKTLNGLKEKMKVMTQKKVAQHMD